MPLYIDRALLCGGGCRIEVKTQEECAAEARKRTENVEKVEEQEEEGVKKKEANVH